MQDIYGKLQNAQVEHRRQVASVEEQLAERERAVEDLQHEVEKAKVAACSFETFCGLMIIQECGQLKIQMLESTVAKLSKRGELDRQLASCNEKLFQFFRCNAYTLVTNTLAAGSLPRKRNIDVTLTRTKTGFARWRTLWVSGTVALLIWRCSWSVGQVALLFPIDHLWILYISVSPPSRLWTNRFEPSPFACSVPHFIISNHTLLRHYHRSCKARRK